jgi:hypothetical protein
VALDGASTRPPPLGTHTSALVLAGTVTVSLNRCSDRAAGAFGGVGDDRRLRCRHGQEQDGADQGARRTSVECHRFPLRRQFDQSGQ